MTRAWVVSLILGLIMMVGGAWLVVYEMQHPPSHSGHIYFFGGIAIAGALLINPTPGQPSPLLMVVKGFVVVVAPIVPWSKVAQARRSSASTPVVPEENIK